MFHNKFSPKVAVKHNSPVHRKVTAYLPNSELRLRRRQVSSLMDHVAARQVEFISVIHECLKSGHGVSTVKQHSSEEVRRRSNLTETVDFPEFIITLDDGVVLRQRMCLSACAYRHLRPGRHKLWGRAHLVNSRNANSAMGLSIEDLISYYSTASALYDTVQSSLWAAFASAAGDLIGGLYYQDSPTSLEIDLYETDEEFVRQVTEKLRRGVELSNVLGSNDSDGRKMFIDMVRLAINEPCAAPEELEELFETHKFSPRGYRAPDNPNPAFYIERRSSDANKTRIFGLGYSRQSVVINGTEKSFSYNVSRDLMALHGTNL